MALLVTDVVAYTVDVDDPGDAMRAFLMDPDKYVVAVIDRTFEIWEPGIGERALTEEEQEAVEAAS